MPSSLCPLRFVAITFLCVLLCWLLDACSRCEDSQQRSGDADGRGERGHRHDAFCLRYRGPGVHRAQPRPRDATPRTKGVHHCFIFYFLLPFYLWDQARPTESNSSYIVHYSVEVSCAPFRLVDFSKQDIANSPSHRPTHALHISYHTSWKSFEMNEWTCLRRKGPRTSIESS